VAESFLSYYPVEDMSKVARDDIVKYLGALVKVAGADGLDDREKAAAIQVVKSFGLDERVFPEAAGLASKDFKGILGNSDLIALLGPYLIRDSVLLSSADGKLSAAEKKAVLAAGKQLGIKPAKVEKIIEAVKTHQKAMALWQTAVS